MKPVNQMTSREKLNFLTFLEENEDRYFNDYSKELKLLINDENNEIRKKAIDLLWDDPSSENLALLITIAETDSEPEVRHRAIIGLGRYIYEGMEFSLSGSFDDAEYNDFAKEIFEETITGDEYKKVRDYLINIFNNNEKTLDERRYALEALSFSIEDDIQEIIRDSYNSSERLMKLSAIFAMGRNGLLCWKNILLTELDNPDELLQKEAITAAGEMALTEAGKKIQELTYSENPDIVKAAIWSLAQSGWEGAYNRLEELTNSDDTEISTLAEEALEEWYTTNSDNEDDNYL